MTVSKWAGVFAILAAVLLVAGVLISGNSPSGDAPDQEWVDYVDDDALLTIIRAYLLTLAGLCLVAFYAFGLRTRLGGADEVDSGFSALAGGATFLAAASMTVGGLFGAAVGAANRFADIPIDPSLARLLDNLMYGALVVAAAVCMAVVMAVVAIQTRRRGSFPSWVLWASVVGILGMAVSIIFIPFVLLPLWLIAMGVVVMRGSARTA